MAPWHSAEPRRSPALNRLRPRDLSADLPAVPSFYRVSEIETLRPAISCIAETLWQTIFEPAFLAVSGGNGTLAPTLRTASTGYDVNI